MWLAAAFGAWSLLLAACHDDPSLQSARQGSGEGADTVFGPHGAVGAAGSSAALVRDCEQACNDKHQAVFATPYYQALTACYCDSCGKSCATMCADPSRDPTPGDDCSRCIVDLQNRDACKAQFEEAQQGCGAETECVSWTMCRETCVHGEGGPRTELCGLAYDPTVPACEACYEQQCCASGKACAKSADCVALLGCASNCGDDRSCAKGCLAAHEEGAGLIDALSTCVDRSCASTCN